MSDPSGLRLPDFIGIGPTRTGSTWLHHALGGVTELPGVKETRFFGERYYKGIDWYTRHFQNSLDRAPIGEICPTYFPSIEAIERIHSYIPDCKIICTFRDPVHRAYSHYKLMRRLAATRDTFEDALAADDGNWESNRYEFYLRKWRARFGAERVLVTLFDDLICDPQAYLDRICRFVGAKRVALAERKFPPRARNEIKRQPTNRSLALVAQMLRSWLEDHEAKLVLKFLRDSRGFRYFFEHGEPFPPLDSEVEARLRGRFRPEVEALEELIGRDLSSWKQNGDSTADRDRRRSDSPKMSQTTHPESL